MQKVCRKAERGVPGISLVLRRRVVLRQERLDLLSLVSIQALGKRLRATTPRLDAVLCNAGIGGWTAMDWPRLFWAMLTDWINATTWPQFKISGLGWVTRPQLPPKEDGSPREEPPLGEVFCANFFGHYLLGHYLAPLLARQRDGDGARGRLVWTSSLDAYGHALDLDDIQALKSTAPYEASKRLTDIVGITSTLPSTAPFVDTYLSAETRRPESPRPRIYVSHPGIVGTSIFALPLVLEYAMFLAFFISRWLGSQWHPVTAEKAACATVWLALAKQSTLDSMEAEEGVGKWGSATDWWGNERVERTEVPGWGWGGKLGERVRKKGRSPYAETLTEAAREEFEAAGKRCWEEMERLRIEWEARLDAAGVGIKME